MIDLAGEEKKQIEAAQTNILRAALSYRSVFAQLLCAYNLGL
jgi:hypothetical protein